MEIKVCRTSEISSKEWMEFVDEFNKTFDRSSTVKSKKEFYSSNLFGYSYHAFSISDSGRVVGHTSLIPSRYNFDGQEVLAGISGGTFVSENYRTDVMLFKKMYVCLKEYAKNDGIVATLGVPNKNSFKYSLKILNKKHIGDLNYFVLPVNLGNIIGTKLKLPINIISKIGVYSWLYLNRLYALFHNPSEEDVKFKLKITDEFLNNRFYKDYESVNTTSFRGYYKVVDEEGVMAAYIMFSEKNSTFNLKSLLKITGIILKKENVDLIMFVGLLNFFPRFLLKLPSSKVPKKLPLTIDIIDEKYKYDDILNIKNWKFSLIDFDVR